MNVTALALDHACTFEFPAHADFRDLVVTQGQIAHACRMLDSAHVVLADVPGFEAWRHQGGDYRARKMEPY
jgi:hypothetical protein